VQKTKHPVPDELGFRTITEKISGNIAPSAERFRPKDSFAGRSGLSISTEFREYYYVASLSRTPLLGSLLPALTNVSCDKHKKWNPNLSKLELYVQTYDRRFLA